MGGGGGGGSHILQRAGEAGVKADQGVSLLAVFAADVSNSVPLCRRSHNQRSSTFLHPLTGHASAESARFILQDQ